MGTVMQYHQGVWVNRLIASRHSDAETAIAWAGNAAVERSLGDDTVDTSGARGDVLPDDVAVVAETELLFTVADYSAVLRACRC
jgi:hypothetical protein